MVKVNNTPYSDSDDNFLIGVRPFKDRWRQAFRIFGVCLKNKQRGRKSKDRADDESLEKNGGVRTLFPSQDGLLAYKGQVLLAIPLLLPLPDLKMKQGDPTNWWDYGT